MKRTVIYQVHLTLCDCESYTENFLTEEDAIAYAKLHLPGATL